jgi:hypothetical protein
MQYGCGLCNNNHRIILCMIITFEQNIFEKPPPEEPAIRAIDFRAIRLRAIYLDSFSLVHASFPNFNFDYCCHDDKNDKNRKWG